jgi:CubicO group peptidase (beta-lactamase class C family)
MARIGRLLLDRGVWDSRRIVPAEWIDESTAVHSHWNTLQYGYLWWIIDAEEHSFAALGDGGNAIYVNPAKDLVVAIASLFKPTAKDRIEFIRKFVEAGLEG